MYVIHSFLFMSTPQKQRAKEEEVRRKEEEEIRSYTSVMKEENMISNKVRRYAVEIKESAVLEGR